MWRICDGESRSKILVVVIPIWGPAIGLSIEIEPEDRTVGDSLQHIAATLLDELMQADIRRRLRSGGFVRSLQEGVAKAGGDQQIGRNVVRILDVAFIFPIAEMAVYRSALGKNVPEFVAVVVSCHLGNDASEIDDGIVIDAGVSRIHSGKAECRGIQAAPTARGRCLQEQRVNQTVVERGRVGTSNIVDEP